MGIPRITISALRGGSGKTILSVGLAAALRNRGVAVAPFKKGPDYIDAGWLALAAGRPCFNLDTFLIDPVGIHDSFRAHAGQDTLALIEGNRGLYDSVDREGTTSTAELAKLLVSPLILAIDCTKSTRTVAALVMGCSVFDPEVDIRGIVLNRVAGSRHEANVRRNVEAYCGIPVLGAVPKLPGEDFPERHMGLVPMQEHDWAVDAVQATAAMAEKYLDVGTLEQVARSPLLPEPPKPAATAGDDVRAELLERVDEAGGERPRVGVVRDSAFQFYYPENLDALEHAGAELVEFSLVDDDGLPDVDALYIGGGFPETHAGALAENSAMRAQVRKAADNGMPMYAECGGLMYLGRELLLDGATYPMAGVFPVVFGLSEKPQGHGYTVVEVVRNNPYFPVGARLKGHEFHYSTVHEWTGDETELAFAMERGKGFSNKMDGLCRANVLATYTHIHALGTPAWAPALVNQAKACRAARRAPLLRVTQSKTGTKA
ncbi:MAG: cobyrinate a,c-diamide synthase [Desulfatibacillaceae bacterium]